MGKQLESIQEELSQKISRTRENYVNEIDEEVEYLYEKYYSTDIIKEKVHCSKLIDNYKVLKEKVHDYESKGGKIEIVYGERSVTRVPVIAVRVGEYGDYNIYTGKKEDLLQVEPVTS